MNLPVFSSAAVAAILSAVALVVVLLYLLKPVSRRLTVPSMLVWRLVLRSRKPTPDRLRWWVSLLLAALIALAIALALVRPHVSALGLEAQNVIIVVDNAATLGAIASDGKTRFQHALSRARELVRSNASGNVLIADTRRQIASPHFQPAEAALQTLAELQVMPGGTPRFPDAAANGGNDVRRVLITDGVAALNVPEGVQTLSVYQVADNVGITAFEVRPLPRDVRRMQAFVEVFNASPGVKQVDLQITGAGAPALQRLLQLKAGARAREIFDVSAYSSGPIRASVTSAYDALPLDDAAFSYVPPSRPMRVALVSNGNPPLERSLKLLPRVQLSVISPGKYAERSGVDAWVFDRFAPKVAPAAPALLFRPGAVDWLPPAAGEMRDTNVASWSSTHPVTESVSLRDVSAEHALSIRTFAQAQVIAADASHRPLILASSAGSRWIELAFSLQDSNLPLQPGFPSFLLNALNWMTGEPLAMSAGLGLIELPVTHAKVLDLQGKAVPVRSLPHASLVEALAPNFYTAIATDHRVRVAANVLNPAVSAINQSRLAETAAAPEIAVHGLNAPAMWLALLLAAAALMLLEWWTYNRRLTI